MKSTFLQILMAAVLICPIKSFSQWSSDPVVNTTVLKLINQQKYHNCISDNTGGAIDVWQDGYYNLYIQKYNSSGVKLWGNNDVLINYGQKTQFTPVIVSDGSGGAIVIWNNPDKDKGIYAQKVDAKGKIKWAEGGILVNNIHAYSDRLQAVGDGIGGAIITWDEKRNSTVEGNSDVFVQRINPAGKIMWKDGGIQVTYSTVPQTPYNIVIDGKGNAMIVYYEIADFLANEENYNLYAQKIDYSGQIKWTSSGIPVSTAKGWQYSSKSICDAAGNLYVIWEDNRSLTNYETDIYAQKIDSKGKILWNLNGTPVCTAKNEQSSCDLSLDGSGGIIAAWSDTRDDINGTGPINSNIYAQRITSSGNSAWKTDGIPICQENERQYFQLILSDTKGGALISWQDYRFNLMVPDVYAQWINSSGQILWKNNGIRILQNSFFTITSPIGGEVWTVGTSPTIKWQTKNTGDGNYLSIYLSTDAGVTWTSIGENVLNDGTFHSWIVPDHPSDKCKIKIYNLFGEFTVISDGLFTIAEPVIKILSPAGGEVWKVGSNPILKWQSTASSKYVNIDLSTNGGTTWQQIEGHTPDDGMIRNWIVPNSPSAKCKIRVTDISGSPSAVSTGFFTISKSLGKSVDQLSSEELPTEFTLNQNFPNPFNPETKINYQIPVGTSQGMFVQLKIYDILGKEIATLVNEEQSPGIYQVSFNGSSLPSGVYIYRLSAGEFTSIKKMILTK